MSEKLALLGGQPSVRSKLNAYNPIGKDELKAVQEVFEQPLLSGFYGSPQPAYFGGKYVKQFEQAWIEKFGVKHAVSVNSATSGLMAAMGAIGISPGDEVIVPPYTMSATAVAPMVYGGVPRFVDIESETFCLDLEKVKKAINPKTKAIIVVNLFGHPAQLTALRQLADKHGLYLIEDNAQAILAKEHESYTGTVGHIGVFSLNVHKHIQCGEGGVCVTDDDDLALRMQLIRNHGENVVDWLQLDNITNILGYNFRLPEISAAIANVQLGRVEAQVSRAKQIGDELTNALRHIEGLETPVIREGCTHVYFMWTATLHASTPRDILLKALQAEGIPVSGGYVKPIYRLPMFQKKIGIGSEHFPFSLSDVTYQANDYPVVEKCHHETVIQIQPVSWDIQQEHFSQIRQGFEKVFSQQDQLINLEEPCSI